MVAGKVSKEQSSSERIATENQMGEGGEEGGERGECRENEYESAGTDQA